MKIRVAQRLAAAIACVGLIAPPSAFAGTAATPAVADIALGEGGVFVGKVVNAQGAPIAGTTVSLRQGGAEIVSTVTDAEGVFAAQGVRGGQYQVVAEEGSVVYRLWSPGTAPPAANQSALIVTGSEIVNGQYVEHPGHHRGGGLVEWVKRHPILVGTGIAAAIAIPLAVADDDDPASP